MEYVFGLETTNNIFEPLLDMESSLHCMNGN